MLSYQHSRKHFWFIQLVTLVLLITFIVLGMWQVNRGNFKEEIQRRTTDNRQEVTSLVDLPFDDPAQWRYQLIKLRGHFVSEKQFLLDNQIRDQQAGYSVLSPFYVQKSGTWVLVDRGWIPQGSNRAEFPVISVHEKPVEILGSVYVPYQKAFTLGEIAQGEDLGWPRRIQYVDYEELSARLGGVLQPFTLRLHPSEASGYRRDWLNTQLSASKHYAYAFQWFALAAAIVVLWFVYFVRPAFISNEEK